VVGDDEGFPGAGGHFLAGEGRFEGEVGLGDVARADKVLDDVRCPGDVGTAAEDDADDGVGGLAVDRVTGADGTRAKGGRVGGEDEPFGFSFGVGVWLGS